MNHQNNPNILDDTSVVLWSKNQKLNILLYYRQKFSLWHPSYGWGGKIKLIYNGATKKSLQDTVVIQNTVLVNKTHL